MGDRTFSADDVLRIYQFFLTENEMETVEEFFSEEVDTSQAQSLAQTVLDIVLELLTILPLGGFLFQILGFFELFGDLLRGLNNAAADLTALVDSGGVDA